MYSTNDRELKQHKYNNAKKDLHMGNSPDMSTAAKKI